MSGLFQPKVPAPIPMVNPADAANRLNDALARRLASGGSNADNLVGAGATGASGNMISPAGMLGAMGGGASVTGLSGMP